MQTSRRVTGPCVGRAPCAQASRFADELAGMLPNDDVVLVNACLRDTAELPGTSLVIVLDEPEANRERLPANLGQPVTMCCPRGHASAIAVDILVLRG